MVKHPRHRPPVDPAHVQDAFCSLFDVQAYSDWVRVVGWADDVEYSNAGSVGGREVRKKSNALVVPRSALNGLIEALEQAREHGTPRSQRRHS